MFKRSHTTSRAKGEGGVVSESVTIHLKEIGKCVTWREGVQNPWKSRDVVYERPQGRKANISICSIRVQMGLASLPNFTSNFGTNKEQHLVVT